jgi:hypothetical protein
MFWGKKLILLLQGLHGLCLIENLTLTGFPCEENSTGPEKVNVGIEI